MSWYAYCIAERQAFPELSRHRRPMPLENVKGLFGNQVFLFPASDLAVLVSEHSEDDAARIDQQCQKDHARVIADCFKQTTLLPFRFNTTFTDDDALRRSIRSNHRHFVANLERFQGKAEMHLKVLVDDVEGASKLQTCCAGKEYLAGLREQAARQRERQARARALSVQLNRMFLPLAEEISCKRLDSGKLLIDIAHLIDRKCVERYQNKYVQAQQTMKDCQFQLSGPWPPYHFVHRPQTGHQTHQPAVPAQVVAAAARVPVTAVSA